MLKRLTLFVALLSALVPAAPVRAATSPTSKASSLPARLEQYLAARAALGQFSGAVLVAEHGQPLINKAYGMANYELGVANRPDTRFLVASLTKQFTAAAILQLRDAGTLSLGDSICRWTEECPDAWRTVTLKQLLTHTSGIWDYEAGLGFEEPDYVAEMARPDHIERLLSQARGKPLEFEPGTKFAYSNTGYLLLANVIEKASGKSYGDYIRERLLIPARMTDSGIVGELAVSGLAGGYSGDPELPRETLMRGIPIARFPMTAQRTGDLSGPHGDAGLYTTARDLLRWFEALEAGKIVGRKSLEEMRTPVLDDYGMGIHVSGQGLDRKYAHDGVLRGYVSRAEWSPVKQRAVIVLSNVDSVRFDKIASDLNRILDGAPYDVPRSHRMTTIAADAMKPYLGEFVMGGKPLTVREDKGMLILASERFNAGLIPIGSDRFYVPLFEGTVQFRRDAKGSIAGAVLHSNGEDRELDRAN